MIDLCLKTNTEEELISELPFARKEDEEGESFWVTDTHDYSLVIIGAMNNRDAVVNEKTFEIIKAPTPIIGFFANIRCKRSIFNLISKDIVTEVPDEKRQYVFA